MSDADFMSFGTGSPAEMAGQSAGMASLLSGLYNGLGDLAKRSFGASEMMRQTGVYDPAPMVEAAMLPMGTGAIAGVPVRGAETVLGAGPIRAYHGSPHDFDKFDLSKIGTGEGAQAYGHGLYFAEKEGVAKGYRDQLAKDTNPGNMYEVQINADPAHFLDWDATLGSQPKAVQDYFAKQLSQFGPDAPMNAQLKIAASRSGGQKNVSQGLAEAGIPGIKYLDQFSRGAGEGSRNYVMFDDSLIDILKKYGIVGAPAAGLLGQAMMPQEQRT